MKRLIPTLILSLTSFLTLGAQEENNQELSFAIGADVSWCTEMESKGKKFYNDNGVSTELMTLMSQIGMNAIRLRVWVNPENKYGPWCDKADVLAKARRAHEAGLKLLIDFHYSDFFTDPSQQAKPAAWASATMDQLKDSVAHHTTDVLQALKDEGIEPLWVQVGNETRPGMIFDEGKIDWNKSGEARYKGYVELSNAGYDAVKSVLPDAKVIVHIDRAPDNNVWFYRDFKKYGGKFDMIGLSCYPEAETWSTDIDNTATQITTLVSTFNVPVMIVETGYFCSKETESEQVMAKLFEKTAGLSNMVGIFYWEPEQYNWWKPAYYTKVGWNAYDRAAFKSNGRPGKGLNPFRQYAETLSVKQVKATVKSLPNNYFDLQGRCLGKDAPLHKGIYIVNGKKVVK